MKVINVSRRLARNVVANTEDTDINIFCQFFIHKDRKRYLEIVDCLRRNVMNPCIHRIYLLNERIYTNDELGISDISPDMTSKVVQENVELRLTFQRVFQFITEKNIKGYHVIINSDIFLDNSIKLLLNTDLHIKKQAIALLRFEYDGKGNPGASRLFGPRMDSQDTWIIHSNFNVVAKQQKAFSFEFGKPGCDNKIVYIFNILGYEIFNDPLLIQSYHYHVTQIRDYGRKDVIPLPWGVVVPAGFTFSQMLNTLGIDVKKCIELSDSLDDYQFNDNDRLYQYVSAKLNAGQHFIIPRIAGVENIYAGFGDVIYQRSRHVSPHVPDSLLTYQVNPDEADYFKRTIWAMKNNAGILLPGIESIIKYSRMYMNAFDHCEIYSGWEPQGDVYKFIDKSHDYIRAKYQDKKVFWAFAFDIFHYIYSPNPWTTALKGRRILIISAFEESIREKMDVETRKLVYDGVDLFPNCSILTIKPPQTQGDNPSESFDIEFDRFTKRLDPLISEFDVALVSCGGYGNLVCDYIYTRGKSAIYIGGALQMYFGVLGTRWVRERPEIVKMFLNKTWSRPKESEKPQNHERIEGSCYW